MRKLVLFPLVVAFLIVAILGSSHTATAQTQASLEGTVTVNGELALADVELVAVLKDGTECGRATTETGGTYSMSLSRDCQVGKTLFFRPADTNDQATTTAVIEEGTQAVAIVFEGLSVKSLLAMGVVAPLTEEPPEEKVAERPLIDGDKLFWLVLSISVGGMMLLAMMTQAKIPGAALGGRVVAKVFGLGGQTAAGDEGGEPPTGGQQQKGSEPSFKHQIEGMVLILVIVAIIILGITEKIGDQGLVSVLAAIVGYAVGRATTEKAPG